MKNKSSRNKSRSRALYQLCLMMFLHFIFNRFSCVTDPVCQLRLHERDRTFSHTEKRVEFRRVYEEAMPGKNPNGWKTRKFTKTTREPPQSQLGMD